MGKSNNKKGQKKPDKGGTGRNAKKLEIDVGKVKNNAPNKPIQLEKLEPPQTPCNEELNFEDFEYDAEISMGAASPIVLQSPVVKMLGLSELQGGVRPTLVELSKEPPKVELPADVQRPQTELPKKSSKSKIETAIDDLDEFKGLDKSPVDPVPPHALDKLRSPIAEVVKDNKKSEKSPDTSDDFADAPNTPKMELRRSTSRSAQKLDDLEGEYEVFMKELASEPVPNPPVTHSVGVNGTVLKPKEILLVAGDKQEADISSPKKGAGDTTKKRSKIKEPAASSESSQKSICDNTLVKSEEPLNSTEKPGIADEKTNSVPKHEEKTTHAIPTDKSSSAQKYITETTASEIAGDTLEIESVRKGLKSTPTKTSHPPLKSRPSQLKDKIAPIQNVDPAQIVKESKAKTLSKGGPKVSALSTSDSPIIGKVPKKSEPANGSPKPQNTVHGLPQASASSDKLMIKMIPTVEITSAEETEAVTNKEFTVPASVQMQAESEDTISSQARLNDDDSNPIVGVAVVGFHHTRGPEVEYWVGPHGNQANLWPYLPFQSMPDGSHSYEENICYFTVLYDPSTGTAPNPTPERDAEGLIIEKSNFNEVETLFGISCTRQIAADDLHNRTPDVTRSTVLKSLVVLARKPVFGPIKEKLKVVTRTYFDQKDFDDRKIIDNLYENVTHMFKHPHSHSEGDFLVGTNPRELIHNFGIQLMIIFKALLAEKKIAFYASDTENLCATQFSLISLIPNLLNNLQDCGSPLLSTYETKLEKPTFLRTSDRSSLLKFLGLPLQVFAAGGMFTPFLPLQLVEELKQPEMQYGMFGSTNKIFFSQGIDYDLFVDVDSHKVTINNSSLRKALEPSSADRAFFNPILQSVKSTWDSKNAEQPTSLGYNGSDDYIRHSFEDYLISLVSSAKYHQHLAKGSTSSLLTREYPTNPLKAFNITWVEMWQQTNNFRIFNKFTDEELFDVVEPQHIGLLNNGKRSDAISEVRGLAKNEQNQDQVPAPNTNTFSGKFFSMFGWSTTTPKIAPPDQQRQSSESTVDSPETIESEGRPATSSNVTPDQASRTPPRSPTRKLFFWNK